VRCLCLRITPPSHPSPHALLAADVHFQYNGFLYGVLIFSITAILEDQILVGSLLFAVLLNLKHIYLYIGPVYFIYLLRSYCFSNGSPFPSSPPSA